MSDITQFLEENYVASLPELVKLIGHKTGVYRLVEKGDIVKVYPDGLGYFTLPDTEEGAAHFAIVSKYYPECVVSGKTALSLYDMALEYIDKIDVDIPKEKNLKNELLNVHRIVEKKIVNVINRSFPEKGIPFEIKVYSAERLLFEAHRYYKGLDSYYYAIKQYKKLYLNDKSPGDQFNSILSFNKKIGQEILDLIHMDS